MARRNALVHLTTLLLACKEEQHRKREVELNNLREFRAAVFAGDSADLAFEAGSDEIVSCLLELNSRELGQIDAALTRWQRRTYGTCESCGSQIPLARLNALPCTQFCIDCERENEENSNELAPESPGNWDQVYDTQALMHDQRISWSQLEMALSDD